MRIRAVASAVLCLALFAPASARDHLPYPAYAACATRFNPGPISVSCPFEYNGRRVTVAGVAAVPQGGAAIIVEIVRNEGPDEQVLFTCSAAGTEGGPEAHCVRRSPVLPVEVGTVLRCRHRGPGYGVIACASP